MTVRPGTTTDADDAVGVLRAGGLVALPTETVYGLAGDASNLETLARIFAVKGRPATHPVIVHLSSIDAIDVWAPNAPSWALEVAERFWPGPLTLIVPKALTVLDAVTGGQQTVGLRVPAHPLTLTVLEQFGRGVAAPSANRYGQVSPTTASHVMAGLGPYLDADRDLVLDGGACPVGVESTILGAWDDTPRLLRPGAVTVDQIAELTGRAVVTDAEGVRVPGTTASHYAPRARVVVVESGQVDVVLASHNGSATVGVIAPASTPIAASYAERLASPTSDAEYAQQLYAALRSADDREVDVVVAVLPSGHGVGRAVRDRLQRAASAPEQR